MLTASADKLVKVWDVQENEAKFIKEIDPQVGTILSLSANPDYPFVFAVSGDNVAENMKVLDISTYKAGSHLKGTLGQIIFINYRLFQFGIISTIVPSYQSHPFKILESRVFCRLRFALRVVPFIIFCVRLFITSRQHLSLWMNIPGK